MNNAHTTHKAVWALFQESMENILSSYEVSKSGCWEWTGYVTDTGYGTFSLKSKNIQAHRYFYENFKGKIPSGLQVDHLCFNRKCVNPKHLEAVTPEVNMKRSWEHRRKLRNNCCPSGHPLSKENGIRLKQIKNGKVIIFTDCRVCRRLVNRKWIAMMKSERLEEYRKAKSISNYKYNHSGKRPNYRADPSLQGLS